MLSKPVFEVLESNRQVESIPVQMIRPTPYQPRRSFSEQSIDELSRSIRRYGLMQPIVVRKIGPNQYELIAGERRLRACKRAGLTRVDALVQIAGEQESAVLALIENLQRENLHFFDEAEAFRNLLLEHGLTQEELARRIGKNQSTVANKLRILKMAPQVRDAIYAARLSERHARTLLRIPDPQMQLELINIIHQEALSVKATEELVEARLDKLYRETEEAPRKRISGFVRDGRLLLNSIRKLVEQSTQNGLSADCRVQDENDYCIVTVRIPKRVVDKQPSAL